jgi:hypothetical protein
VLRDRESQNTALKLLLLILEKRRGKCASRMVTTMAPLLNGRRSSGSFAMFGGDAPGFPAPHCLSRRAFEPPVDHRSSWQLRSLTGAGDDSSRAFDLCGMNGHGPFVSLDPSADRVSDLPVLHRREICRALSR